MALLSAGQEIILDVTIHFHPRSQGIQVMVYILTKWFHGVLYRIHDL